MSSAGYQEVNFVKQQLLKDFENIKQNDGRNV